MMRVSKRVSRATALSIVALAVCSQPAIASDVSSGYLYYTVNGITYANRSFVSNSTVMTGYVQVKRPDGGTIPGGWSSGQASLYRNGALCKSAAMYYFPDPVPSWLGGNAVKNCGTGNYTTRGSTGAYNGSGYNYFYTATSPILQH